MTSQQAITLLRNLEQSLDDYCELNDEGKAAFNKAITALELFGNSERLPSAQPELRSDCIANGGDWECDHIHCRKGRLPSAQPEKLYTKADYIMALHKEYGCSLARAEEAHNKALEYLRDEMMMEGGKNE